MDQYVTAKAGAGFRLRLVLDSHFLDEWAEFVDQWPFALSLALNRTAKLAGMALRKSLPEHFKIRSGWTAGGLGIPKDRSKWASKRHLSVEIGTANEYLRPHTEGVDEHTRVPGKTPWGLVPASGLRAAMGGKLSRRSDWAKSLIRQKKAARVTLLSTRREVIIATEKFGHGFAEGRPIYFPTLDSDVDIKPVWPMEAIIRETFDAQWEREGAKAIRFAVRTAKKR